MPGNYIEFPFRIIEKRRRRGRKKNCQCKACRDKTARTVMTGAERPVRKIRVVKR